MGRDGDSSGGTLVQSRRRKVRRSRVHPNNRIAVTVGCVVTQHAFGPAPKAPAAGISSRDDCFFLIFFLFDPSLLRCLTKPLLRYQTEHSKLGSNLTGQMAIQQTPCFELRALFNLLSRALGRFTAPPGPFKADSPACVRIVASRFFACHGFGWKGDGAAMATMLRPRVGKIQQQCYLVVC